MRMCDCRMPVFNAKYSENSFGEAYCTKCGGSPNPSLHNPNPPGPRRSATLQQFNIEKEGVKQLYRYEKVNHSFAGFFVPKLALKAHDVIKETDKSYILAHYPKNRVVSKTGKKRFAHPTKQEALQACLFRTQRAVEIQTTFLEQQKGYLHLIEQQIKEDGNGI